MKKICLITVGCLMSLVAMAQNYTAVYANKSDIWQILDSKISSVFILSLNNSELSEIKTKLDPLAKEVGYRVSSKKNDLHEFTLIFQKETDPRYLTKTLIFLGVEKCQVENEQIEVHIISTLAE